jgi:hypothetical protein
MKSKILVFLLLTVFLFSGCAMQYADLKKRIGALEKRSAAFEITLKDMLSAESGVPGEVLSRDELLERMLDMTSETGAAKIRAFTETIGGAAGALDKINADNNLYTNDLAFIYDINSTTVYFYRYNADTTCPTEVNPWIVVADDCATAGAAFKGQWELMSGFGFGRSATPTTVWNDSDATDYDDNAKIYINCTNTGSGTEDCDLYIQVQRNGAIDTGLRIIGDAGPQMLLEGGANAKDDDRWDGIVITGKVAGESLGMFAAVYMNGTDGKFHLADADAAGEWPARGIAVECSDQTWPCDADDGVFVLVQGIIRDDGGFEWTDEGVKIYLDDVTAGELTETAPSTSGDCVQLIGWSLTNDEAYFNFSGHYLEVE